MHSSQRPRSGQTRFSSMRATRPMRRRMARRWKCRRSATRMNRLLCDLLDVVSIEAKQLAVLPSANDFASVISESLEVFSPLATAKGFTVVAEHIPHTILGHFDRDRVLQVLGNLLG